MKTGGNLKAIDGELNGEIILVWDAVSKAAGYIVELNAGGEKNEWEQVDYVINPKCTISGLNTSATYLFRVSAVESNSGGLWSESVMKQL
ncbi:MAG TPA: fibronectin type III domain-containing protein [Ignavibacteria bacterium]|nr:fibronectin type III domain-containing protein [Ignavibacteria bacterium]HMQ99582.1 fibronectin type III domain-containing protein [Ignavibacteria bacterium]